MNDYLGRTVRIGDEIVYPVVRYGELVMRRATVTGTNDKGLVLTINNGEGRKDTKATYSTPGRFIIVTPLI